MKTKNLIILPLGRDSFTSEAPSHFTKRTTERSERLPDQVTTGEGEPQSGPCADCAVLSFISEERGRFIGKIKGIIIICPRIVKI